MSTLDFRPWIARLSDEQRALANESRKELAARAQLAASPTREQGKLHVEMYRGVPDMDEFASVMSGEVERLPGSWLAFTGCKPHSEDGVAHIHLFEPEGEDEPVPTMWLKGRRQAILAETWNTEAVGAGDEGALGNAPILEWAEQVAGRKGTPLAFGADVDQPSGPHWLMEPVGFDGSAICMPKLVTELDLDPPFGAQMYIKLIHPEAALAWALFS